eukprot:11166528-Lingulodinium_polyedra.AAC.1
MSLVSNRCRSAKRRSRVFHRNAGSLATMAGRAWPRKRRACRAGLVKSCRGERGLLGRLSRTELTQWHGQSPVER